MALLVSIIDLPLYTLIVILAVFHSDGISEVSIQLFMMWASISEIAGAALFTSLVLKDSIPMDLCGGKSFIIFSTSTLGVFCI